MPTARETTTNTALSGIELKTLLREDAERLLTEEGLLSDYVAYGRICYRLTLELMVEGPDETKKLSDTFIESRAAARDLIARVPAFAALRPPPLRDPPPSSGAVTAAIALFRRIISPNAERLRVGLPVPVMVRQQDGTTDQQMVRYPRPDDAGDGDVTVEDASERAHVRWGSA
jgi:hypothetical protein